MQKKQDIRTKRFFLFSFFVQTIYKSTNYLNIKKFPNKSVALSKVRNINLKVIEIILR